MNDEEYNVGFKKPPRECAFKKGQSGNPAGRPKNKVEENPLDRIWSRRASYRGPDGRMRLVTRRKRHVDANLAAAMQGSLDAMEELFRLRKLGASEGSSTDRTMRVVFTKETKPKKAAR